MSEAAKDEPSMADILACVRRILTEEDLKRGDLARAGETPMVLTNLLAADGSIVTIAPVQAPRARPAALPPLDPFARLDLLKGHVSRLVAMGPPQPETPGDPSAAQKFAAALLSAASLILPASLARRIPGRAAKSDAAGIDAEQAPCRPIEDAANTARTKAERRLDGVYAVSDTVDVASLHLAPVDEEDKEASGVARRKVRKACRAAAHADTSRARRAKGKAAPAAASNDEQPEAPAPTPERAAAGTATALAACSKPPRADRGGVPFAVPRDLDPRQQIELMLAQQIAAAHSAAMTLTSAAVHSMHEGAERADGADAQEPGAGARKRKRSADAARLANSAARLMQAYNEGLATLARLGVDPQQKAAGPSTAAPETAPPAAPLRIVDAGARHKSHAELPARQGAAGRRRRRALPPRALTH